MDEHQTLSCLLLSMSMMDVLVEFKSITLSPGLLSSQDFHVKTRSLFIYVDPLWTLLYATFIFSSFFHHKIYILSMSRQLLRIKFKTKNRNLCNLHQTCARSRKNESFNIREIFYNQNSRIELFTLINF